VPAGTSLEDLLTSGVTGVSHRAAGGAIYGFGTGTSDSVPAMLSHGEHVWTAREVAAAGGHQMMYQLRQAVLGGLGFAAGGPVGYDAKALSSLSVGSPDLGAVLAGLNGGISRLGSRSLDGLAPAARIRIEGGYHQSFHEPVPSQSVEHLALVGHTRLLHDLENR
jgi:hypothetical protein